MPPACPAVPMKCGATDTKTSQTGNEGGGKIHAVSFQVDILIKAIMASYNQGKLLEIALFVFYLTKTK